MASYFSEQTAAALIEIEKRPNLTDLGQQTKRNFESNNLPATDQSQAIRFSQAEIKEVCPPRQQIQVEVAKKPTKRTSSSTFQLKMRKTRDRKANFTGDEIKALLQGVNKHYKGLIIKDKNMPSYKTKRLVWQKITEKVNKANDNRVCRTAQEVKDKFACLKRAARLVNLGKAVPDEYYLQVMDILNGKVPENPTEPESEESGIEFVESSTETSTRERKANFSNKEVMALVKEVVKYFKILNNDARSSEMMLVKQKCWQIIAEKVNAVSGFSINRTWKEVKDKFKGLKRLARSEARWSGKQLDPTTLLALDVVNGLSSASLDWNNIEAAWAKLKSDEESPEASRKLNLKKHKGTISKDTKSLQCQNLTSEECECLVSEIYHLKEKLLSSDSENFQESERNVLQAWRIVTEKVNKVLNRKVRWTAKVLKEKWTALKEGVEFLENFHKNGFARAHFSPHIDKILSVINYSSTVNPLDRQAGEGVETANEMCFDYNEDEVLSVDVKKERNDEGDYQSSCVPSTDAQTSRHMEPITSNTLSRQHSLNSAVLRLHDIANKAFDASKKGAKKMLSLPGTVQQHFDAIAHSCRALRDYGIDAGAVVFAFEKSLVRTCGSGILSEIMGLDSVTNLLTDKLLQAQSTNFSAKFGTEGWRVYTIAPSPAHPSSDHKLQLQDSEVEDNESLLTPSLKDDEEPELSLLRVTFENKTPQSHKPHQNQAVNDSINQSLSVPPKLTEAKMNSHVSSANSYSFGEVEDYEVLTGEIVQDGASVAVVQEAIDSLKVLMALDGQDYSEDLARMQSLLEPTLSGSLSVVVKTALEQMPDSGECSCQYCGKIFSKGSGLRIHLRTHTGERPFKCEFCDAAFTQSASYQLHKRRKHTGERPHSCDQCGQRFFRSYDIQLHMRKEHNVDIPKKRKLTPSGQKYPCEFCGKVFNEKKFLGTHQRCHFKSQEQNEFPCDVCHKVFPQKHRLVRHKLRHQGNRPFQCEVCGDKFTEKANLKVHKRIHSGEQPYKCEFCGQGFYSSSPLKVHRRTHTGERPFLCDLCGASFPIGFQLRRHRRSHTGEKPYLCKECGERFKEKDQLNIHMRKHTGIEPYSCKTCGKAMQTHHKLAKHLRIHTGEKPYSCEVCGEKFARSDVLCLHKRTKHGIATPNRNPNAAFQQQKNVTKTNQQAACQPTPQMPHHSENKNRASHSERPFHHFSSASASLSVNQPVFPTDPSYLMHHDPHLAASSHMAAILPPGVMSHLAGLPHTGFHHM